MKGTIVRCLEELVVKQFGKDKWEKSLEEAGIKNPRMFLPFEDVEDSVVLKLITTVCKNLNISLSQAADAFGDYWVNVYSQKLYPQYYAIHKTARDFLLGMDAVHVAMTRTIKDAKPPRFEYEWKNEDTLIMHYKSHRGLTDFAVGLIKGVGKFYNEELRITTFGTDKIEIVFPSKT
jgi:hypothetical protein